MSGNSSVSSAAARSSSIVLQHKPLSTHWFSFGPHGVANSVKGTRLLCEVWTSRNCHELGKSQWHLPYLDMSRKGFGINIAFRLVSSRHRDNCCNTRCKYLLVNESCLHSFARHLSPFVFLPDKFAESFTREQRTRLIYLLPPLILEIVLSSITGTLL